MEREFLEEMEYVGDIPEGWKWIKVEDFAEVVSGGTPRTDKPEFWNGDIAWITPKDLSDFKFRYIERGERNISREGLENSNAKLLPRGTILLSSRAPVGYLAIAKNELSTNQGFQSLIPKENAISEFLYYLLKNNIEYLKSQASGTTFGELSKSTLKKLIFPLPPLHEQKAIAEVLSSIDDKIELLHRQNKTLEEMAMTLFRQWFIEPTKDGLPKGWEEVSLGEFFPVITGKKDANFATDDGSYPFFTCSQKTLKAPSYSFDGNAILLAGNGDFNIKRYKGKFEAYQRTYVLIPYDPEYFNFLYLFMKFNLDEITGSFKGSVINYITKDMITNFKFSLPKDRSSIKKDKFLYFDRIYDKVDANTSQIQTLEKLRDTLLPKLMSGEIRVKL
jgi:type I restriction enzyme S subunit